MKIIDLLNKIANGEEVPKKIKYNDKIWRLASNRTYFIGSDYGYDFWLEHGNDRFEDEPITLNDEVEILEEDKKENEIPNINLDNMKDIGAKVGKAYRELFEGFNKGWNTPLEEENKIPEKLNQTLNRNDIGDDYYRYIMENRFTINEIIDYLKSKGE